MNRQEVNILEKEFNIKVNEDVLSKMAVWFDMFKEYNSHTNLISKGDMEFVFEKHVFDSLALILHLDLNKNYKIVDVGTGGGFPCLILSIFFKNLNVIGVDSIGKKINFIKSVKEKLNLQNLEVINERIENIAPLNADYVVTRAVGKISKIYDLSFKHLKKSGQMIFYKSSNYTDELEDFKKKHKNKIEIVNYILPTSEKHKRCLIAICQNQ